MTEPQGNLEGDRRRPAPSTVSDAENLLLTERIKSAFRLWFVSIGSQGRGYASTEEGMLRQLARISETPFTGAWRRS